MSSFFLYFLKARNKVSEIINNGIVHYRDDIDLQNLIDFGQKEVSGPRIPGKQHFLTVILVPK